MLSNDQDKFSQFLASHPDDKIYLGMVVPPRPGVRLFFTTIQHYLRSSRQSDIEIHLVPWDGIIWGALAVPQGVADRAAYLLPRCGLDSSLGLPDASPRPGGPTLFPGGRDLLLLNSRTNVRRHCRLTAAEVLQREQVLIQRIEAGERPPVETFQSLVWGEIRETKRNRMPVRPVQAEPARGPAC